MATIFLDACDDRFSSLIALVEAGEKVEFTRVGRPVARLEIVPRVSESDISRALEALKEMDEHAEAMDLGPFDWEEWKAYRDEGRR